MAYDMDTRGEVAQTSERSTCAIRVSCLNKITLEARWRFMRTDLPLSGKS
jgi:hypothetical protein